MSGACVLTIGHSAHAIERFLGLLAMHDVDVLVDVRSAPWSRRSPWFRRSPLRAQLAAAGIDYVYLGAALGGRPAGAIAGAEVDRALSRVLALAMDRRVALMCAEADPAHCHRARAIAPSLAARGARVRHVLADGAIEDHTVTRTRFDARAARAVRDLFEP